MKIAIASTLVGSTLVTGTVLMGINRAYATEIILNGGFEFIALGHTNGDNSGHFTQNPLNVPNWTSSVTLPNLLIIVSDPQSIFNYPTEYVQVQTNTTHDLYQQITIGSSSGTLTMQAARRNDNLNFSGSVFLDLYNGYLNSFDSAIPITPDLSSSPTLTPTPQIYSRTYNNLAAGNYTVRIGGTSSSGLFQAGMDNVSFNATTIPEPSSILGILSLGVLGIGATLQRKL